MGEERKGWRSSRRLSWWLGLAVLAVYVGWILAPYLRSVIVRDAAVTTWINVATSPIYGNVDVHLPSPGQRVGPDGRLAMVRNEQADRSQIELDSADVAQGEANVKELSAYLAKLRKLEADRQALVGQYAQTFEKSMAIETARTRNELVLVTRRLELAKASAARLDSLARKGNTSRADADNAEAQAVDMNLLREERQQILEQDELRQHAADRGVFLATDGSDPDWAFRSSDTLQLEMAHTETALADAQAALVKARAGVTAAKAELERITARAVTVPPDSLVWSVIVGAGAAVDVGTPVAQWLDCDAMLVDVPVADAVLALLHEGMPADVILEGERQVRRGRVIVTRGAAATLGNADLAAVAKGRTPGVGQVLLALEHTPQDAARCPIGRAANVDFPDVGLISVLRARLRL